MDLKTFFIKKVMMSFFVSVTLITAAMAIVGLIFERDVRFGYGAFLSPLFFGGIASFPLLVKYSKTELSFKQTVIRNAIHLVLIEVLVIGVLYFNGVLANWDMTISLGFTIFIIDLTVNLVLWVNDKKTAKEFNEALSLMQKNCEQSITAKYI